MSHTHTHTSAVLTISQAAFAEISKKLRDAGYDHAFIENMESPGIDMHGIMLKSEVVAPLRPAGEPLCKSRRPYKLRINKQAFLKP
jgi:hypothetical protein